MFFSITSVSVCFFLVIAEVLTILTTEFTSPLLLKQFAVSLNAYFFNVIFILWAVCRCLCHQEALVKEVLISISLSPG